MKLGALLVCLSPFAATAQETEIQRALIERDRQSAEFARPELRELHQRQDQAHLPPRPDQRFLEQRERDAVTRTEKPPATPDYRPLPLPGGPRPGVDPIPVQGVGG